MASHTPPPPHRDRACVLARMCMTAPGTVPWRSPRCRVRGNTSAGTATSACTSSPTSWRASARSTTRRLRRTASGPSRGSQSQCGDSAPCTHALHTHAHTHTHIHTHTYTHIHSHRHTHTRTHSHRHTQAHRHTGTRTRTHHARAAASCCVDVNRCVLHVFASCSPACSPVPRVRDVTDHVRVAARSCVLIMIICLAL